MKAKVFMIVLLFTFLLSIFPVYAEPALEGVLDILGFTSRILVATETFPVGRYDITLYAEYAGYRGSNKLRWYKVGTSDFNLVFDGPEGLSSSDPSGLVSPPLTKSFTISNEFGLSLFSPDGTQKLVGILMGNNTRKSIKAQMTQICSLLGSRTWREEETLTTMTWFSR